MPDDNAIYLQNPVKSYYYVRDVASGYTGFPGFENYNNVYYLTNTPGKTLNWFLTENYDNGVMELYTYLKTLYNSPSPLDTVWLTTTRSNAEESDINLSTITLTDLQNIAVININDYASISQDTTYNATGWYKVDLLSKVTYDQNYYSVYPEHNRNWKLLLINTLPAEPDADTKVNDIARIDDYEFSNLDINESKPYFYREVSGKTNAIKSDRKYILDNIMVGNDTSDYIQRLYMKFEVPSINGKLEYAFLVMHSHYVPSGGEEKLLPYNMYCLLSNDPNNWNESSTLTTLNTIYSNSVSNDVNAGFLKQNITDEYYFNNVEGSSNYVNNGIKDALDNNFSHITLIVDSPDVSDLTEVVSPGSTGNSDILRMGIDTNLKYFIGKRTTGEPTTNTPVIIYGWTPPQMDVSTNTISWNTSVGTSTNSGSFNLINGAQGTLNAQANISYTGDSGWFTLNTDTTNVNLGPSQSTAINYTIDVAGIAAGTHYATLTLYSEDSIPDTQTITITLDVYDNVYADTDQENVEYNIHYKKPIDDLTFTLTVHNIEESSPDYSYTIEKQSGATWISSINPSSGTFSYVDPLYWMYTDYNHEITISFNTSNLAPGIHEETILIKHDTETIDSFDIKVHVHTTSTGATYSYEII